MRSVWILIALTIIIGSIIMAIHDVDTTSDGRTSATPLQHDIESSRKADGTQGVTQKVNDDTGPYVSTKDGRLLVNDGSNDIIIIGRQANGAYGMKQSVAGVNVDDATYTQTVFDSSNLTFQVIDVITDTATRSPGAGALTRTIQTNLGWAPPSLAYLSTYLYGAGQPTETGLVGAGGGYAVQADYNVYGPLGGSEGYVTITYPANGTLSTIEWTFTIYLFNTVLPTI